MDGVEYRVIEVAGQRYRWHWDKSLNVFLDPISENRQRLVCVAWPENDEQYPDRQSFLDAAAAIMTEPFVAEAIAFARSTGWRPADRGRDYVIHFDEGSFIAVGESPI